jgi:adenylate kinase family enzyme
VSVNDDQNHNPPATLPALGRRILIVGASCAGKTTLGTDLAARIGVPFIDIDALYWGPAWTAVATSVLCERVDRATSDDGWVLAGNFSSQRHVSWPRAQSVVWLDLPLPVVIARIVARSYRRSRSGDLLWGVNRESFLRQLKLWDENQSLIRWTLSHYGGLRQRYEASMRDPAYRHLSWHRLRSQREVEDWKRELTRDVADV